MVQRGRCRHLRRKCKGGVVARDGGERSRIAPRFYWGESGLVRYDFYFLGIVLCKPHGIMDLWDVRRVSHFNPIACSVGHGAILCGLYDKSQEYTNRC